LDQFYTTSHEDPVLVIGASGVDVIGQVKGEIRQKTSNPARIRSSFGGIARNVAENLARLGQAVKLITAIGSDIAGDEMISQLHEAGVDTSNVLQTPDYSTGYYLGVVKADGVMQFALDDMRAISVLTPSYLRERSELFKEASLVFIDANLSTDTLRTTMSLARRAKVPVCADPTSTVLANRLRPYLNRLHLITPNSNEAAIFCDQPFEAAKSQQALKVGKYLVGQGVDIVLIALAEIGVVYASSETSGHIPALRTKIVDPTGAGDALNATVIFALLNGLSLDEAVRLGVSAASLTLRHNGSVVPNLSLELLYDQLVI
jgi:pseudouridine kinase